MRWWLPCLALVLPTSASGQDPVRVVEVQLSSFAFTPETISLRAGEPVILRLTNSGRGGHNFSAPEFFEAASIAPDQGGAVERGAIEVPSRQSVSIRLTPAAGRYRLRCTHTLHGTFGMRGEILVE